MKEILYIQAGNLSNHIGTHFWNTQELYFTYDEDEIPLTTHDVSFREGLARNVKNFGTAVKQRAEGDTVDASEVGPTWDGNIHEHIEDPLPENEYQAHFEEERLFGGTEATEDTENKDYLVLDPPKYWSDFNRVFYTQKSLHQIPPIGILRDSDNNWGLGHLVYDTYDQEVDLMEGSVRSFIEECDNIQGLQIMNDTSLFGAFTDRFLRKFRDEHEKLPALTFSFLNASFSSVDSTKPWDVKAALNDALSVQSLNEYSTSSCIVQTPNLAWKQDGWNAELDIDLTSMYQTSAVLSAHIENSTIPLRLKSNSVDASAFCSQLTCGGGMRFTHLSGIFPALNQDPPPEFRAQLYDFSTCRFESGSRCQLYARRNVCRGFEGKAVQEYKNWMDTLQLTSGLHSSGGLPPYPLPTSFPSLFKCQPKRPSSIPILSCLTNSSASSSIFRHYAKLAESCIKLKMGLEIIEMDEMKELRDDMWSLHDTYQDVGEAGKEVENDEMENDGLGEDEEYS